MMMDAKNTKDSKDSKDTDMQIEHFDCECTSPEHTLRFCYFVPDKNDPAELYAELYLCQYHNFFSRVWVAIKYILGYKCKFGHWDTWILRRKDCERLRDLTTKIIEFDKAKVVLEKAVKKTKSTKSPKKS